MTCSCANTLFGDSTGDEDQTSSSSIMSGNDKIPKPLEINADNIIKPNFEELQEEHRQAYEEYKKAREEKEMQEFLAKFKKDRQGNITPVGEIKFPPLHDEQVKPSASNTFSPEV